MFSFLLVVICIIKAWVILVIAECRLQQRWLLLIIRLLNISVFKCMSLILFLRRWTAEACSKDKRSVPLLSQQHYLLNKRVQLLFTRTPIQLLLGFVKILLDSLPVHFDVATVVSDLRREDRCALNFKRAFHSTSVTTGGTLWAKGRLPAARGDLHRGTWLQLCQPSGKDTRRTWNKSRSSVASNTPADIRHYQVLRVEHWGHCKQSSTPPAAFALPAHHPLTLPMASWVATGYLLARLSDFLPTSPSHHLWRLAYSVRSTTLSLISSASSVDFQKAPCKCVGIVRALKDSKRRSCPCALNDHHKTSRSWSDPSCRDPSSFYYSTPLWPRQHNPAGTQSD